MIGGRQDLISPANFLSLSAAAMLESFFGTLSDCHEYPVIARPESLGNPEGSLKDL
jgi:hypothetical protein